MNCRSAEQLLSAERDGALAPRERAALDSHLGECAGCRRFRAVLADAAEVLRTSGAEVRVPDAGLAWQAIRREIRAGAAAAPQRSARWFSRWALPVGAAAALAAIAVMVVPHWSQPNAAPAAPREVARADFVEVPGATTSSMVYVDAKSGWLVVWAVDSAHPNSG